uniref:Uncharacterized protein LOC114327640 n=1 Tax=Diabrotica virgifera virgifera TaxID=50390 RepID=A0A6P7FFT6_DIAVI
MVREDSKKRSADKEEPSKQVILRLHAELTRLNAQVQSSAQDVLTLTESLAPKYDNGVEVEDIDVTIRSEATVDQNSAKSEDISTKNMAAKHQQDKSDNKIDSQAPIEDEAVEMEDTYAKMLSGKEAARMIAEIKRTATDLTPMLQTMKEYNHNQEFDIKSVEQQLIKCREQQRIELLEVENLLTATYSMFERLGTEFTFDSKGQDSLAFSDFLDDNMDVATSSPLPNS